MGNPIVPRGSEKISLGGKIEMRLVICYFLLALIFVGSYNSPAVRAYDPVRDAVKSAVERYNDRQFKLLQDPKNEELQKQFFETVEPNSVAEKEAKELLQRYLDRGSRLLKESTHKIEIVEVNLPPDRDRSLVREGSIAKVVTEEDSQWDSVACKRFVQKKNKHYYTLIWKNGRGWGVTEDKFDFQGPTQVIPNCVPSTNN